MLLLTSQQRCGLPCAGLCLWYPKEAAKVIMVKLIFCNNPRDSNKITCLDKPGFKVKVKQKP